MLTSLLAAAAAASAPCPVDALAKASLEDTQAAWLARFNALDLPCFLRFFAADATIFSPTPSEENGRRVEPPQLAEYWSGSFSRLGQRRRTLSITPQDVTITRLAPGAAVVSFHLSGDAYPSRRTLVWRQDAAGWRIVHLHASRLAPEPASPTAPR